MTCSSSSLILHSVCASRLTGGNAYLRRPWGQLCASASVLSVASDREQNHWQWVASGDATGLPEQLRTDSKSAGPPGDGVSTPQEVPLETARRPPD